MANSVKRLKRSSRRSSRNSTKRSSRRSTKRSTKRSSRRSTKRSTKRSSRRSSRNKRKSKKMRGGTQEQVQRQKLAKKQLSSMPNIYVNKIDIENIQNSAKFLNFINDNVLKPIYEIDDFEIQNVEVKKISNSVKAYIEIPLTVSGNALYIEMQNISSQYDDDKNIYEITGFSEQ